MTVLNKTMEKYPWLLLYVESKIFDLKVAPVRMLVTRNNGEVCVEREQTKVNS